MYFITDIVITVKVRIFPTNLKLLRCPSYKQEHERFEKLDLKIQIVNFIDLNEVEDDHSFFFFQEIIHLSFIFMSVFAYS